MLLNSAISDVSTIVYAASGKTALITTFFSNNSDTNTTLLSVHAVPRGGSVSNLTRILNQYELFPRDTYTFNTEKMIIEAGDSLIALTSAGGDVSATISVLPIPE